MSILTGFWIGFSLLSLGATLWQRERHVKAIVKAINDHGIGATTWEELNTFYGKKVEVRDDSK